ncbi:hypothetical protein PG996_013277 [Apiospora saccharicola]|uniref:Oxidoreductase n=1 Tax=Apiospora saccharicola TaxID=335842 RepID=A0ABR1U738_9PEZI
MKFDFDKDIPDLSGKVIFVTGGNVGLGKETICQLAKHKPAHIYLAARSAARANEAIKEIQERVPNAAPITFIECDLTSFASIKAATATFQSQASELHILINNAGIMACPADVTQEGYEIQFGTNHMGHAMLTKLLLPTLLKTAEKAPKGDVRIVSLSSLGEAYASNDPYAGGDAHLKSDMASLSTWVRYGNSKLANVHHSRALAQRHPQLRCVAVHPGPVRTELSRGPLATYAAFSLIVGPLYWLASRLAFVDVSEGAKNQVWAATSPDAQSGHFYYPVAVDDKGSAQAKDEKLCEQLWAWTEKELEAHM